MSNDYSNQVINGQMCVWLQSHGWQPAKLGSEIKVGDEIVYNWGYTYEVISIDRETPKTITVSIKSGKNSWNNDGSVYQQKINKNTYKPIVVK